ncbi:membrane protein [Sphingomonas sp. HMP6]|nr:membrane protein [Sphingomonas sp. HMP6]
MGMWTKITRLFVIKNKFEAFAVIYALALGSVERGVHYLDQYPGFGGWLLFAVCPIAVFMAGARILDSVERNAAL